MKKLILLFAVAFFAITTLFGTNSVTFNPTADGFVSQNTDLYNGSNITMEVKNQNAYNREAFINFDLTGMSITPQHAKLKLFVYSIDATDDFMVSAYINTGSAISGTLNYTNRPVTGTKSIDIYVNQTNSVGTWVEFDFTDFFKAQDLSTNKLFSVRLVIPQPASSPLIKFSSMEVSNKPQLILSDAPVLGVYEMPYSNINSITSSAPFLAVGDPVNAFNAVGALPGMGHVTASDNTSWRNTSGGFPISLTVKLKEAININKFHIWNLNWMSGATDYTVRGVKNMDIYISSSTDDLSAVTDFTDSRWKKVSAPGLSLTKATGLATCTGEDVAVTGADNARWFAFSVTSNHGTGNYVGLSEVKVYKEIKTLNTAIESTSAQSVNLSSENGILSIRNIIPGSKLALYNIQGQLIHSQVCAEMNVQLKVLAGIYIVKVNGSSYKALVK